jgi:electron transport complex protein RnfD
LTEHAPHLEITTAPFTHTRQSTPRIMVEVFIAAVPVAAAATWYFGVAALLVILCAVAGAVLTEWFFLTDRKGLGSLKDGSALLTGILLALTLPPSVPLWMAFLGGAVGIGLGKAIWGGLGQNLFNPALVGRAFLQAAFPTVMTTWTAPGSGFLNIQSSTIAVPLGQAATDVVTTATPLGLAKFEGKITEVLPLFLGNTGGCLGETASVLIILAGLYMGFRRLFDWRLPVSTLLTVAALSSLLHVINPEAYPGAQFMLLSGGLMFGAVFMVTDPVTTPITARGAWIFGFGVGLLVVLIRLWGGLPEGVMYAILLMNSVTPLINQYTQPRRFGG